MALAVVLICVGHSRSLHRQVKRHRLFQDAVATRTEVQDVQDVSIFVPPDVVNP